MAAHKRKQHIRPGPTDNFTISDGSPYHYLCIAIVKQAVDDYTDALKTGNERMIYDCEKFFKSQWYDSMCRIDGEKIIRKILLKVLNYLDQKNFLLQSEIFYF